MNDEEFVRAGYKFGIKIGLNMANAYINFIDPILRGIACVYIKDTRTNKISYKIDIDRRILNLSDSTVFYVMVHELTHLQCKIFEETDDESHDDNFWGYFESNLRHLKLYDLTWDEYNEILKLDWNYKINKFYEPLLNDDQISDSEGKTYYLISSNINLKKDCSPLDKPAEKKKERVIYKDLTPITQINSYIDFFLKIFEGKNTLVNQKILMLNFDYSGFDENDVINKKTEDCEDILL